MESIEQSNVVEESCLVANSPSDQGTVQDQPASQCKHLQLDLSTFRNFAPFLIVCQDYASISGCRFDKSVFHDTVFRPHGDDSPGACPLTTSVSSGGSTSEVRPGSSTPLSLAVETAAPVVEEFAKRLKAGETILLDELDRCSRIVTSECVRNAMIAAFPRFDLWPPSPMPIEVAEDDYTYEDVSAPMPIIAQRAYNDEQRRKREALDCGGHSQLQQRAHTAFFIVDFAEQMGVPLPPMPETQTMMLKEFAGRMAEWDAQQTPRPDGDSDVRDDFLRGLGIGAGADRIRDQMGNWWEENGTSLIWVAGATAVGMAARMNPISAVAVTGVMLARWAWGHKDAFDSEPASAGELPPWAAAWTEDTNQYDTPEEVTVLQ